MDQMRLELMVLLFQDSGEIYRGPMMVRLLRNTTTDPPSEGIYHCLVEDDTLTEQTVYVGLYNSGGGTHTNIMYMPTNTIL